MHNLGATLEQALQLHQNGNLTQAESLYREILRQHPGQPDALNLLGVMANQVGQPEVDRALPAQADFGDGFLTLAASAGRARA